MNNYILNNNIVKIGENKIIITKSYNFNSPVFFIISNNKKTKIIGNKIDNNSYEVIINIAKKSKLELSIIDNNIEEIKSLHFINNTTPIVDVDDLIIEYQYIKDKIYLKIKKKNPIKNSFYLNFEGDLNKNIFWNSDLKEIEITFPYKIKGYAYVNFKINGVLKKIKLYNIDDFPKNLIKIKGGVKLNKICDFDLKLKSDTSEWMIKKGEFFVYLDMNSHENFKIYIDDYLIFEQTIKYHNFLPELTILNNPLRIKISQPFHEDVSLRFKNRNDTWKIPQGKTETLLNYDKGLRLLEIENIENALYHNDSWIYHIK